MKVTALIPDTIVDQVKKYAGGKTLSESLVIALKEWVALKRIKELNSQVSLSPFEFSTGFSAQKIRASNRKRCNGSMK